MLLTVTHEQDRERFLLLRRSLREVGCDWPHLVVVHADENLSGYRTDPQVTVVPTSAVLDRSIERRRTALHYPRRDLRRWIRRGPLIAGWYAQQLSKLAAVRLVDDPVIVHLDSDLVALQPLTETMFTADGRTRLFVNDDMRGDGSDEWNHRAAQFLGLPDVQRQFIHWPTVWNGPTLTAMLASVRRPWQQTFTAANVFEYPAYGIWATAQGGLVESPPLPVLNFSEWDQMLELIPRLKQGRESGAVFAAVQSRLGIPANTYAKELLGH